MLTVPFDAAVVEADRQGRSVLDHAPGCPAAGALLGLAPLVLAG